LAVRLAVAPTDSTATIVFYSPTEYH
jgi:hypothetical protein